MLALELHSDTLPAGKLLTMDLSKGLRDMKSSPFTIKEGVEYKYVYNPMSYRTTALTPGGG